MLKIFRGATALSVLLAMSMAAKAADLPVRPPPAPAYAPPVYAPPPFSWTGFYIGGNLGGAWGSQGSITDSLNGIDFNAGRASNGAFTGGGQVGANYQFNNFVAGIEADFDWFANHNNNGNGVLVPSIGQTIQVTSNDRWLTTVAGRFGFAADHLLYYGKAGGAWVGNGNFTVTDATTGASVATSSGGTNTGWVAGAGVEWAFAPHWTGKLEYDYVGLSSKSYTVPAGAPVLANDTFSTSSRNVQMVTAGINYLFNWGP
jgi:outer membrane immunogenic protein